MKKLFNGLLASTALGLSVGAAQAGNVHWSIGINLPPVATVISNGPYYGYGPAYAPAPVYAPPVVYRPAPVYYAEPAYYPGPAYFPEPVYYSPPRYYGPPALVIDRRWDPPHGYWGPGGPDHRHHHRDGRWQR